MHLREVMLSACEIGILYSLLCCSILYLTWIIGSSWMELMINKKEGIVSFLGLRGESKCRKKDLLVNAKRPS